MCNGRAVFVLLVVVAAACWGSKPVFAHRLKRQACGQNKYQCKDGSCIDAKLICDGVNDCADKSDESQDSCINTYVPALTSFISNSVLSSSVPCLISTFQCGSGECVRGSSKCDGKEDCQDGSDERLPECPAPTPVQCSRNQFKCNSGACVAKSATCDGVRDCNDGSDESQNLCTAISNIQHSCIFPAVPLNGRYKIEGCESCVPKPGERTPNQQFIVLKYSCDSGYEISGESIVFCAPGGQWSYDLPKCVPRTCKPITSDSIYAECRLNRRKVSCEQQIPPGTTAIVKCKQYFVSISISEYQNLVCGLDGEWSDIVMKCRPACGRDRAEGGILISNGKLAEYGEFPWYIGIYRFENDDFQQICGGSLISTRYVISAAHCFWNDALKASNPESEYKMVAGKLHRNYHHTDPEQQIRAVLKIEITEFYLGSVNSYRDDIAVITVTEPFQITAAVQPVCVDWDDVNYLVPNSIGKVAGFGITEKGEPSETLLTAELPYIQYSECIKFVPPGFRQYFSKDTICAGNRNGTNVCKGDSGGGLCFLQNANPEGSSVRLYFLQGVVSVGKTTNTGGCALKEYVVFTRISKYLQFLSKYREF